jgi:glycosyltransferase involved in cell wall biosynthesis
MRQVLAARRRAIRTADLCVVPSDGRARALEAATGRRDIAVVWNGPRRDEAAAPHAPTNGAVVRFLYQGSIVPARLPPAVVEALSQVDARAQLVIAGYTTIGHPGYLEALLAHARTRGVADRVTYAGVLNRTALLDLAAGSDVGLALFPIDTTDPNESTMVGASNKAFEYLARGLPLIVSDRPEWREAFTGRELARPCDPARAESVAAALRWFVERPAERWAMGERGRQRVLAGWNYETTFAPVLETLVGRPPKAAADR